VAKELTRGGPSTVLPTGARLGRPRHARWNPSVGHLRALALVLPLVVLLGAFVFYPLVKLGIDSLTTGEGTGNYSAVLDSAATRKALVTTLLAGLLITAITLVVGAMLAWQLCTVRSGAVRAVLWLAVLAPFWMGTVVKNYAIVLLVSREGLINDLLAALGLGRAQILYTTGAVVIGITYTMVPYAVFSLYSVFAGIDKTLPLAARSMGASRAQALRTVVAPLALPGIVASAALVFSISLGFYVTPVLLGGGQAAFMASAIQANIFDFYNYGFAAAASTILLVVAVLVLGATLALVGRERLVRAVA
jgi:mannopine transport system permease protein